MICMAQVQCPLSVNCHTRICPASHQACFLSITCLTFSRLLSHANPPFAPQPTNAHLPDQGHWEVGEHGGIVRSDQRYLLRALLCCNSRHVEVGEGMKELIWPPHPTPTWYTGEVRRFDGWSITSPTRGDATRDTGLHVGTWNCWQAAATDGSPDSFWFLIFGLRKSRAS